MISFSEIGNIKVPGVYSEVDNSLANQGLTGKESCGLLIGQKLNTGSMEYNRVYTVYNVTDALKLTGYGSELYRAAKAWFKHNKYNALKLIAVEQTTGVAATFTITVTATNAASGTLSLYIDGEALKITVAEGASAASIAADIAAAVNDGGYGVIADADEHVVTLTAVHKGEAGNGTDVRLNYYDSDETPTGVSLAIAAGTKGSGNVSLAAVIASIGETYATDIVSSYTDTQNLKLLKAEMNRRFGAMIMNDATLYIAPHGTMSDLMSLSESLNSEHIVVAENYNTPNNPFIRAVKLAAICAYEAQIDPARQYRTLVLTDELPATVSLDWSERQILLSHGVATFVSDTSGNVAIERIVTTYQKNSLGAKDESYLDLTTVKTLTYLRWSYVNRMKVKYPRHKLADDSYEVRGGSAIVTPKVIASEALALAKDWYAAGLVENIDDFKNSMVTERNAMDVNRIDQLLRPDIINNLMVIAAKIQFKL